MELIKANQLITAEIRKAIIEKEVVYQNISERYLRVAQASARRIVKDIPDRDQINGKETGLVHLSGLLAKRICSDYSIREVDQSQVYRFFTACREYYNQFTLEEIRLAFELALFGELDEYLPKDSKGQPDKSAYQNFSLEFICKILNAFKAHRQKVWNKIYKLALEEPKEVSDDEKQEHFDKFAETVEELYESWKRGEALNLMWAGYIVTHLIKQGFIVDRQISESERSRAFQMIMSNPIEESKRKRLKIAFSSTQDNIELDGMAERLKNEALIFEAFRNRRDKK
jgi:hypothetical protein